MADVREPAVAGRFYPSNPEQLRKDVSSYLSPQERKTRVIGCMAPHAGYVYSGQVAGAVFARIEIPAVCIVLCPNHTGRGHPLAIMKKGSWRTPLGMVELCTPLAEALATLFPALTDDSSAHLFEHAIEVELPFLQILRPDLSFVPIAIGTGQLMILEHLGHAVAKAIRDSGEAILIIASSDMNHYENDERTRIKDRKAIDQILALNPRGLHETVMNESISMCGFGPAVAMLTAANQLGAKKTELVQYATSGDIFGERESVVGYAGIVVL